MKEVIDARGLACPQPVILTKNKMKEFSEIEVIVDNDTAYENICRLAASSGYNLSYEKNDNIYRIYLAGRDLANNVQADDITPSCVNQETIVVISSDIMGSGDAELGRILMKAFMNTLTKIDNSPSKVIFYNSGVKLAAEGSGSDDDIAYLAEKGTELLICGTCADYFKIKNNIKVGTISNMFDILTAMNSAGRLIKP